MPAQAPTPTDVSTQALAALGEQIRAARKALGVSAVSTAQAAGLSRVTLHRVERGEPSVTMGAYLNVMAALGLNFGILPRPPEPAPRAAKRLLPARIRLTDYPQLQRIAWHVRGTDELTAAEAAGIYARHGRHLDAAALSQHERALMDALQQTFDQGAATGV